MDYELLGGSARKVIEAEAAKTGLKAILPPLVPYNSHEWPWKIDPNSGTGPATMEEIHDKKKLLFFMKSRLNEV